MLMVRFMFTGDAASHEQSDNSTILRKVFNKETCQLAVSKATGKFKATFPIRRFK